MIRAAGDRDPSIHVASRGAAATRLCGCPPRRRDPSPRTIRAAAAASPRPVLGRSARQPRRRRDPSTDNPRGSHGAAATRPRIHDKRALQTTPPHAQADADAVTLADQLAAAGGDADLGEKLRRSEDMAATLEARVAELTARERKMDALRRGVAERRGEVDADTARWPRGNLFEL